MQTHETIDMKIYRHECAKRNPLIYILTSKINREEESKQTDEAMERLSNMLKGRLQSLHENKTSKQRRIKTRVLLQCLL